MVKTTKRLTVLSVCNLTNPGYHADGDGLYLQISKYGSCSWLFIFTQQGKRYEMGLGVLRDVSLAQARDKTRV